MRVAVCLKRVPTRAEIDPLTGRVSIDERFAGISAADRAALEWALRLAQASGGDVTAVTAGPAAADGPLREALAVGAASGVRVDLPSDAPSGHVAAALASVLTDAEVICCGDYSADRGSGSVPAFLAAELAAAQALGLLDAELGEGAIRVTRRLDQGGREILSVPLPAVLSFEGGLELRRAALPAVLSSRDAALVVRPAPPGLRASVVGAIGAGVVEVAQRPYRPRARVLPAPSGGTRQRVLSLTGALVERTPPQLLHLEPEEAAAAIVEQLRTWGHLSP